MRILRCGAALALALGVSVANAAGLGKLTVNSALGQVLNAEIDLVSLQPGELDALTARVAAPEAFRDARIEYSSALRLLRFAVEKRANGVPYLKVTSIAPINEPFVDVLIEVTWPAGRVQREYPILLDPPGYAQGKVAPPVTTAAAPSRAPETPPASAPAVSSQEPSTPSNAAAPATVTPSSGPSASAELGKSSPSAAPREASGDTYGPVQKGDTLRKIAEETKPSSVSLEQMLVALYRENKGAFAGNNMNRLKTGQILKVPSAEEVEKVAAKDANKEIRTHVSDWKSYREGIAGSVANTPSSTSASTPNASSGRIGSAAVAPPPAPVADTSKDVLKLSKTDATGKAAGAGKAGGGADRTAALQEELTAKDKALREAQSRVVDLEKQIRDMQRLLDLKGSAPTKPDTKVAVAPTPVPAPAAKTPEPVKAPEPAKVEPVKPADAPKADAAKTDTKPGDTKAPDTKVAVAPTPAPTTTTTPADATKPAPPKPAEPPKADAPKPAAKKPAPPPRTIMDDLTDNWLVLAGVGVLIAGGIGGLLFMRNRRRRYEDGPISGMTSAFPSDLKPDSNTSKPAGGLVDTGNSSFLTDFDKTGPGTIDTDEVDPVAEAEVYIAYGRDAQAEEILKEAMARDKGRHEIALKLLEIYHARKSATAFETVAKELRSSIGENHPLWHKAAAMGAQIDPTNPLYVGAASGTATFAAIAAPAVAPAAPKPPDLDFDLEGSSSSASGSHAAAPASTDFDLDLDSGKPEPSQTHTAAADQQPHVLDFDIAPSAPAAVDVPAEAPKEEKPSFDFDLSGLDFPGSKPAGASAAPAASSAPAMDLTDLSLDGPGDSAGGGEGVGTKLELAKAYLEIGDKDGAREILQEVAKEGSSAQREEAQKLISSL